MIRRRDNCQSAMQITGNTIDTDKSNRKSQDVKKRIRLLTGKPGARRNLNVAKLATVLGQSTTQQKKNLGEQMMRVSIMNEEESSVEREKPAVPTMI
jgi:hypothetical protein